MFYLFAFVCLHLDELDIDQVIHEKGDGPGNPAWIHISASTEKNKREIKAIGCYAKKGNQVLSLEDALKLGTAL